MTLQTTLQWTPWQPLYEAWKGSKIPAEPGLYRIRRAGASGLDYVGQTGTGTMNLKKRLGMLKGAWGDKMPYRDPHTLGPALWALLHRDRCTFEVSVCPISDPTPDRKALEALAISLYRQEHRCSPTLNFGRMPKGYKMSSGNSQKLVEAGKRFRGGPCDDDTQSHLPGLAPLGSLDGPTHLQTWCGHPWTDWTPIETYKSVPTKAEGLYRIWDKGQPTLLYVGEGKIGNRVGAHLNKKSKPNHPQGELIASARSLMFSYVIGPDWHRHQRLELENDLIASHVLAHGLRPSAQFLG